MSPEAAEISPVLARLQAELEDLAVGGLRAAGPDRLRVLDGLQQELARIGAAHLAERLAALATAVRGGGRDAAVALMRTQAGLRMVDRLLTLETAAERLGAHLPAQEP